MGLARRESDFTKYLQKEKDFSRGTGESHIINSSEGHGEINRLMNSLLYRESWSAESF